MYSLITASSRPTVETKCRLAQNHEIALPFPVNTAKWIATLPLVKRTSCDTAVFGGIEIITCT
jgi:hypothetical protein